MQHIITQADLKKEIRQLEESQAIEWLVLKEQFLSTVEAIKPANMLRNTVKTILSTPNQKTTVGNAIFGMVTGLAATRLFMEKGPNPVARLVAGAIMGIGTASGTSRALAGIKSMGANLFQKIVQRNSPDEHNGELH